MSESRMRSMPKVDKPSKFSQQQKQQQDAKRKPITARKEMSKEEKESMLNLASRIMTSTVCE